MSGREAGQDWQLCSPVLCPGVGLLLGAGSAVGCTAVTFFLTLLCLMQKGRFGSWVCVDLKQVCACESTPKCRRAVQAISWAEVSLWTPGLGASQFLGPSIGGCMKAYVSPCIPAVAGGGGLGAENSAKEAPTRGM